MPRFNPGDFIEDTRGSIAMIEEYIQKDQVYKVREIKRFDEPTIALTRFSERMSDVHIDMLGNGFFSTEIADKYWKFSENSAVIKFIKLEQLHAKKMRVLR